MWKEEAGPLWGYGRTDGGGWAGERRLPRFGDTDERTVGGGRVRGGCPALGTRTDGRRGVGG